MKSICSVATDGMCDRSVGRSVYVRYTFRERRINNSLIVDTILNDENKSIMFERGDGETFFTYIMSFELTYSHTVFIVQVR